MEIHEIAPFLRYFESIRGRTRRVAERIPASEVEWAPRADAFSLGDVVRHLAATERWMFAENVAGRPSRYPGCGRELAAGREAVLSYLDRMHAEATAIFASLTPEDLQAECRTPAGTPLRTWKWLRAMVEHEVHHRGQLYLMLAGLGVETPPLYGLTSEQVRQRSLSPD